MSGKLTIDDVIKQNTRLVAMLVEFIDCLEDGQPHEGTDKVVKKARTLLKKMDAAK
jgi:hypothetical protein